MTSPRVRLGFFGSFHPEFRKAGNSSTGMVSLMSQSARVQSITVFAQKGASCPPWVAPSRIEVRESWVPDQARMIRNAFDRMAESQSEFDVFLCNTFPTAFGRRLMANGAGMRAMTDLAKSSAKPVFTYLHNCVATQSVARLGYRPHSLPAATARVLERRLLRFSKVVVPLESQARALQYAYGTTPKVCPLPYVEAAGAMMGAQIDGASLPEGAPRLLILGNWGPQKDIGGTVSLLRGLERRGEDFRATVAGAVNPRFPDFRARLDDAQRLLEGDRVTFMGEVPEPDLFSVFQNHDVLLLPYLAAGGYSGAMNLGAYFGLRLVAYDEPMLREYDRILGAGTTFVRPDDLESAIGALSRALVEGKEARLRRAELRRTHHGTAQEAVDHLLQILTAG
jgi:hypothetical protein